MDPSGDEEEDLSSSSGGGGPSPFELVSQSAFSSALKPAFLHIVRTLSEKFPHTKVLPTVFRNFDEFYLLFDSLVQWHYFVTRRATLAESFYSLQRQDDGHLTKRRSFSRRLRLSFLLSILLPYLKDKLDKVYDKNQEEEAIGNTKKTNELIKYYPLIMKILSLLELITFLRYSFGLSRSHSLTFLLLGLKLNYSSAKEEEGDSLFPLKLSFKTLLRIFGESVLIAVEAGSFFVQFLDWWHNDPKKERVMITSLPLPIAPHQDKEKYKGLPAQGLVKIGEEEKGLCPLCRGRIRNPTAVATSGVVYCYSCILPKIREGGTCPLTSIRAEMDNLIRVFP